MNEIISIRRRRFVRATAAAGALCAAFTEGTAADEDIDAESGEQDPKATHEEYPEPLFWEDQFVVQSSVQA